MLNSKLYEIDHRTIKLLVGLIALFLANVTSFFSASSILSISESYHYGGWARDVFVGSLFAIAAFLAAYNGWSRSEMLLSKGAAFAAMGVAMFPRECGEHTEVIPKVHGTAAAAMFLILTALCYVFFKRAKGKGRTNATRRAYVYAICGGAIVLSIAILVIDHFLSGGIVAKVPRLVYYCERTGLIAFGIAWLAASHILPGITDEEEQWINTGRSPEF